jgi:hypothetical protein
VQNIRFVFTDCLHFIRTHLINFEDQQRVFSFCNGPFFSSNFVSEFQWALIALSFAVKRPGSKADFSTLGAEDKNAWDDTFNTTYAFAQWCLSKG